MNKIISTLFKQVDLDRSVLIGYYGGGNFGDELLLEVLMNLFSRHQARALAVTYQHPERYPIYHHEFDYRLIDMSNRVSVLRAIIKNKNVVIGGGGLWGLDVNFNIFVLSSLLFFSRFVLRKRVYLLGVGYYNSTSRLGHVSAWLAGKSANRIVTRDRESLQNFSNVSGHVSIDTDIAYNLLQLDLKPYQPDFDLLNERVQVTGKTLFITMRRFKPHQANTYTTNIEAHLDANQDIDIILAIMEPREVDPEGFALITYWQEKYTNVQSLEFTYNPVALYLFFQHHHEQLAVISPQFHVIITAHLASVPFLPLAYDNKVTELLRVISDEQTIPINDLSSRDLQSFTDTVKQASR